MSRVTNPSNWTPNCWTAAAISAIAVALVVAHYSLGAP